MTNLELQEGIVQNLLLGLKKQSEAYLDLISNNEYTHDQRKDFEKELSDINKVLNELSGKTINYTVAELEALKVQFNDRLTQLNSIITNLEINTLKIEFDSLTPEQKAFLKGEKGDKGEKGENSFELAVRYGFVGNEIEYLNSLKGKDGVNGINGVNGIDGADGQNGLSAYELAVNSGFTGTLNQWLESLKGADGQDAESSIFDFDTLDTIQKEKISSYLFNLTQFTDLLQRLTNLENNSTGGDNENIEIIKQYNELNQYIFNSSDLLQKQYYFAFKLALQEFDVVSIVVANSTQSYTINYEVSESVYGKNLELTSSNLPENIVEYPFYNINSENEIFAFYLKFENENNEVIYPFDSYAITISREGNNLVSEFVEVTADKSFYDSLPKPPFIG